MPDPVERFADLARQYRAWVLTESTSGPLAARRALELLASLYVAALNLPRVWCEDREGTELPPLPVRRKVYPALIARLPFQHYGVVFDSLPVPAEAPVIGDLADDLADVFLDIEAGLRWFEAGTRAEAVWEWGFHFVHHWGAHATSAIRVLHAWLASEQPALLADHTDL